MLFFPPTNFLSGLAANDSPAFTDEYHQNISLQLLFSILWFNHTKQPPHWPQECSIIQSTRQSQGQVASLYVCRYCHNRSSEIRYSKYSVFVVTPRVQGKEIVGNPGEKLCCLPKIKGTWWSGQCWRVHVWRPKLANPWVCQQLLMPREKAPVVHFLISNVESISCIWQNMHDSRDRHKLDKTIMGNLGYIFNLKVWDFPQATLWFQQTLQGPCKHVLYMLLRNWGGFFLQLASCLPNYGECLKSLMFVIRNYRANTSLTDNLSNGQIKSKWEKRKTSDPVKNQQFVIWDVLLSSLTNFLLVNWLNLQFSIFNF